MIAQKGKKVNRVARGGKRAGQIMKTPAGPQIKITPAGSVRSGELFVFPRSTGGGTQMIPSRSQHCVQPHSVL